MAIAPENIKLMASEDLSDNPEGGGRMSPNEVVNGNVQNLMPNQSDLDHAGGRVNLRKAFLLVDTNDTETYAGANAILSVPCQDPRVSVCIFKTDEPDDTRVEAKDRVESYVVKGPRFPGWLWGNQPQGARSIIIFATKGTPAPKIGDRLYLVNNEGLGNEEHQYVAINKVETSRSELTATAQSSQYGATAMQYKRDIFKLGLDNELDYTFLGREIDNNDSASTNVYTTTAYNSAKYYGVMKLTAPVSADDLAVNVDSIFAHLVPSAKAESPLTDLSLGEAGPVIGSGVEFTVTQTSFVLTNGARFYFGRGIKPKSLTFVIGGHTYTDDGNGLLFEATTQRGIVDYEEGAITFLAVTNTTGTATATAIIGTGVTRVSNTRITPVTLANQGYVFTAILNPPPANGTVMVDYKAEGNWYRLRDNGNGILVPDIDGTGTGTFSSQTNTAILTCAALPDIDSGIIWYWGSPVEVVDIAQDVTIDIAEISHQLANFPVAPGSLTIEWPTANGTATAEDDGTGVITGAATGYLDHAHGKLLFRPTVLPTAGTQFTISYNKHDKVVGNAGSTYTGGVLTITLPQAPVKPGSVSVGVTINFDGGVSYNYIVYDNGNGAVHAAGGAGALSGSSLVAGVPVKLPEKTASVPSLSGTIDYTLAVIQMTIGNLKGSLTVRDYNVSYID